MVQTWRDLVESRLQNLDHRNNNDMLDNENNMSVFQLFNLVLRSEECPGLSSRPKELGRLESPGHSIRILFIINNPYFMTSVRSYFICISLIWFKHHVA